MKTSEKLKFIIKLSGITQEKLADKIGISFVALNSLVNERSTAREKTANKIDALYLEFTGQKQIPGRVLIAKKELLKTKGEKNKQILKTILNNPDILKQFTLSLTYNTNKIEGSTLSENETAAILFENLAFKDKTLAEQLEAKNHQSALQFLFSYISEGQHINEAFILRLHSILLNGINRDAGFYRKHGVRIVGANVPTANHLKVPELMKLLVKNVQEEKKDLILHIAKIHSRFEQIHPFSDGNGRIGRLIIQAMLLKNNLAPAIIKQENKILYLKYLNISQIKEDFSLLEDFICDTIIESYKTIER
jgi:Fic family protein/DNA-binding XRE family transcriptional regulator